MRLDKRTQTVEQRRLAVLAVLSERPMTRPELQAAFNLTPAQVHNVLEILRLDGDVVSWVPPGQKLATYRATTEVERQCREGIATGPRHTTEPTPGGGTIYRPTNAWRPGPDRLCARAGSQGVSSLARESGA